MEPGTQKNTRIILQCNKCKQCNKSKHKIQKVAILWEK